MLRHSRPINSLGACLGRGRTGRLALCVAFCLSCLSDGPLSAGAPASREEAIAAFVIESPMQTVEQGFFLMGTPRSVDTTFSLALQYDDTEQPQRRIWLPRFDIDRDEVALGTYLRWLAQTRRPVPEELRTLTEHLMRVHAMSAEALARWPALYVTWTEASAYCRDQGKRLPSEAEWEKAARGTDANLFPWGDAAPTSSLAMFGQYHVHEIPIVAPIDTGEVGRSPYGLRHMAGNAAEWVADWFGIDYYMTMPDRNPPGPSTGRYKVVRGGSWKSTPVLLRTATRSGAPPDQRAATIGFRCARSADSPSTPTP